MKKLLLFFILFLTTLLFSQCSKEELSLPEITCALPGYRSDTLKWEKRLFEEDQPQKLDSGFSNRMTASPWPIK